MSQNNKKNPISREDVSKNTDRDSRNKNKKGRYGKGTNKDSRNKNSKRDDSRYVSESNDVIWYAKSEQLLKDAGSLSFFNPIGTALDWINTNADTSLLVNSVPTALPGIEAIDVVPVPGISPNALSPINIAANAIYSFVRHANSGHANYEASDLMMYMLAVDNAYAYCSWMIRIYGTLMLYTQDNKYYPRHLLAMQHVDWDDLRSHINDFRGFLNQWIMRLSTIYVPASFDVYNRHSWMFLGYYKDDASVKGQTMFYNLAGYYKYNPTLTTSGGGLQYVARPTASTQAPWKFEDIVTHANAIVDPIVLDEDMNIMAGDILKAYGAEGIYKLSLIPDNFVVVPMYNEEVLYQMRHVVVPGGSLLSNITQSANTLLFHISTQDNCGQNFKRVVNFWDDNNDPARVMVSTRLMPTWANDEVIDCGTEFPVGVRICTLAYPIGQSEPLMLVYNVHSFVNSGSVVRNDILAAANVTQFRYAPYIYYYSEPEQEKYLMDAVAGDISNYTLISDDTLKKLHNCALLSEFNVPRLAMT